MAPLIGLGPSFLEQLRGDGRRRRRSARRPTRSRAHTACVTHARSRESATPAHAPYPELLCRLITKRRRDDTTDTSHDFNPHASRVLSPQTV